MTRRAGAALLAAVALLPAISGAARAGEAAVCPAARLNELQYIATHNSYHLAPDAAVLSLMRSSGYAENAKWTAARLIPALSYDHAPLKVQLRYGIRSLELDVLYDPEGGRFARPGAIKALTRVGSALATPFDPEDALSAPGFKVLHMPDLDFRSTCPTLRRCLGEIREWSDENPGHLPLIVMIEPKEKAKPALADAYAPARVATLEGPAWDALEAEIREAFPDERLITPDGVRGDAASLREAIRQRGWPKVSAVGGRVLFALGNEPEAVARYLAHRPGGRGGVFFFDHGLGDPQTAWVFRSDPAAADIPALVRSGYLVYTRADANGDQARHNDTSGRARALAGAQVVSTDYPWPNWRLSSYRVSFAGERFVRAGPLFAGPCAGAAAPG